jgi:RNase P/RNase MRP subunit p29
MNHDLIGVDVTVVAAANKSLVGKTGKVIDETKHTITINQGGTRLTIIKKDATFLINNKKIKGTTLNKRPEESIR